MTEKNQRAQENVLIVYVSRTNNTKAVEKMIQSKVGGDLIELELTTPYPEDYQKTANQVAEEHNRNVLPALKTKIDLQNYGGYEKQGIMYVTEGRKAKQVSNDLDA
jgi:hypothetical protein